MNTTKPCDDRLEAVVALVMGELDAAAKVELNEHLTRCEACRRYFDEFAEDEKTVRSGFEALVRAASPHPTRRRLIDGMVNRNLARTFPNTTILKG